MRGEVADATEHRTRNQATIESDRVRRHPLRIIFDCRGDDSDFLGRRSETKVVNRIF
ncbi:MAG TPA: hypothetical protein VFG62_25120 [Rhodopila sp.]|nr:hypothetical protein [Rhodopila sp.]